MISPYSLSSENLKSSQNDLYGWNHKAKEPHHWGLSKNVILPTQWCVKNSILKNGWFWGQGIPRPTSSCHQGGSVKHAGALSDGFEIQVIPSWTKNHFSGSAKTKKRIRVLLGVALGGCYLQTTTRNRYPPLPSRQAKPPQTCIDQMCSCVSLWCQ